MTHRFEHRRQNIVIILFVAALVFTLQGALAADLRASPLERPVKLDLWGARISDFIQEVRNQTGVEIFLYPDDFPAASDKTDFYLISGNVPLRSVLECLARRFSFRYRVSQSGRIEISKGYEWAASDPALLFQRLDAIIPPSGTEIHALDNRLREFIKPMSLLNGEYTLVFEKSPLPNRPHSVRAVSVLPPTLSDYLERGLSCLGGDSGDYPPPVADSQRLFATARLDAGDWEKMLGRRIGMPRGRDLRAILGEICSQGQFVIALAGPPTVGANLTGLASESITMGRITEELGKRYNLGKRIFLAAGALVFEAGPVNEWETDPRSHELYWGGLAVAGFDARILATRLGGGNNLLHQVKNSVFPTLWRDPACSLVYSEVSGRLAAVAPINVIEALAEWLALQR